MSEDVGLFGPDSVTWKLHQEPILWLGGLRSLYLQALHPRAIAGVAQNSAYKDDPWGRLLRTANYVGTVVFGSTEEVEQASARLRRIHDRLSAVDPYTGERFRIDEPDLLRWVHVTEVESFLSTYRRCGAPLGRGDGDRYVDEMRASAELVGLDPAAVPASEAEVRDYYATIRPQLRVSKVARRNVAWGFAPPMPRWVRIGTPARPAWAATVGLAAAMLPRWARRLYGLPGLPSTDLAATVNGRVFRRSLALLPDRVAGNPAHRDALRRTQAERAA
jgi:uncharacterized protein (DUF2236 family)